MNLPQHSLKDAQHNIHIPIDIGATNLPILYQVSCTDTERMNIGPLLHLALAKLSLDFKDNWNAAHTALRWTRLGFTWTWFYAFKLSNMKVEIK